MALFCVRQRTQEPISGRTTTSGSSSDFTPVLLYLRACSQQPPLPHSPTPFHNLAGHLPPLYPCAESSTHEKTPVLSKPVTPDPHSEGQAKALASTHSHEGDNFVHVRSDVALHKGHQHSQLLEQKLKRGRGQQVGPRRDPEPPGSPSVRGSE